MKTVCRTCGLWIWTYRRDDLRLANSHRIEFTEPAYEASLGANPEFVTEMVRFRYESFVTPRSVFDYDVRTRERILLKQQPVLGGYDARLYVSERVHATAADGTRIPISLVYRRDSFAQCSRSGGGRKRGRAAVVVWVWELWDFGAGTFSSNRLSLLDRGVVFAIAHIRGGGEMGKPWHDAGTDDEQDEHVHRFHRLRGIPGRSNDIRRRKNSPLKAAAQADC